jgi:hypothetical protein
MTVRFSGAITTEPVVSVRVVVVVVVVWAVAGTAASTPSAATPAMSACFMGSPPRKKLACPRRHNAVPASAFPVFKPLRRKISF